MEDGRMNLVTRGTRPFRVLERQANLPYPAGVIEFVVDRGDEPDPSWPARAGRLRRAGQRATDRDPEDRSWTQ